MVILDSNTPQGKWKMMGRITKVVPDRRGVVRKPLVRIEIAEWHRLPVKLCPLTQVLRYASQTLTRPAMFLSIL